MKRKFLSLLAALAILLAPTYGFAQTVIGQGVIAETTSASSPTTTTAEQTLATYTLPAGALLNVGKRLMVHAEFGTLSNANTKTFKLYFGSEVISQTTTTSGANGILELTITKSGTNQQVVWGNGYAGTTNVTPYSASGSENDAAGIVIKATMTTPSAVGDGYLNDFYVESLN
jgi:hypothetical protein